MNPNQPQSPMPPLPPQDYLNQIAPQQVKKSFFVMGPKLVLIIGAFLVIAVIVVAIVVNVLVQNSRGPLEHMAARLESTATIAAAAQKNLKSNQLRSLNSSLNLYLTDINGDIATPLKSAGVDVEKLDKKIVSAESGSDITATLEEARFNGYFDRTYAREMSYRLQTLITLMQQVYASTGNSELKSFVKTVYDNLEPTQKSFDEFNSANG